eukprot:350672-Chlamydomonas_euryale.AAC.2
MHAVINATRAFSCDPVTVVHPTLLIRDARDSVAVRMPAADTSLFHTHRSGQPRYKPLVDVTTSPAPPGPFSARSMPFRARLVSFRAPLVPFPAPSATLLAPPVPFPAFQVPFPVPTLPFPAPPVPFAAHPLPFPAAARGSLR